MVRPGLDLAVPRRNRERISFRGLQKFVLEILAAQTGRADTN